MRKLYYLAYGSNLHPVRLGERVPSARLLGWVGLDGCRLAFHTAGEDGSGKCDLVVTGTETDRAYAALYELAEGEKPNLDGAEGPPYRIAEWRVPLAGETYPAFVYLARKEAVDPASVPYAWYRDVVWRGAQYLGLPDDYVARIGTVAARQDPDPQRRQRHHGLLVRMVEPAAG